MTVAEMIAVLQTHDPAAHVLTRDALGYRLAVARKISSTEYGIRPAGPKIAIVPEDGR